MRYITATCIIVMLLAVGVAFQQAQQVEGNIIGGYVNHLVNEATSTALRSNRGLLGTVVVVDPPSVGKLEIYDATGTAATTTGKRMTSFGTTSTAGTYSFDARTTEGLVVEADGGFDGLYNIMYSGF